MDKARDELMSHVVRCDVLEAGMDDRMEWLDDTMKFMAERYPQLGDLQLAQLEMVGRQFLRPPIPYGADHNATNRGGRQAPADEAATQAEEVEASESHEGEATAESETDGAARDAA
jgi:hypothetical protein